MNEICVNDEYILKFGSYAAYQPDMVTVVYVDGDEAVCRMLNWYKTPLIRIPLQVINDYGRKL